MNKAQGKINNIKIYNFKIFRNLEIKDLKRVNLIGGKNNIGKTAFLEAIELVTLPKSIIEIVYCVNRILTRRYNDLKNIEFDFFYDENKELKIDINNHQKLSMEIFPLKQQNFRLLIDDQEILPEPYMKIWFNHQDRQLPVSMLTKNQKNINNFKSKNVKFIPSSSLNTLLISILYGNLIEFDKEEFLNNSLQLFDQNIKSLKQIVKENEVVLKVKLTDRLVPLSSLGEGINRFIAILCAIWASKDGYLLIDEIENGIHYTNYEKLWKIIFEASKEANCQVFATTHSKECIEAFNKVNKENEGAYLEFYMNKKTNNILVKNRDYEQLSYSLSHKGRFRGE
ncbi:AAA family ATPase [Hydrogenimonas thermophila]|uniref:AAA family ATPase n=1 Tax=Hydrogenimonas thermophila TaxID=223786 RepID=UPI0029373B95|nr:AAA family ATPase [Hydrogenimonas thermophila]WOE70846.1 AAA family ATPase [Hydrogenimonas thermophila]WOE73364.1 AAA family ATPase [Hydrogenimonas thermophila]